MKKLKNLEVHICLARDFVGSTIFIHFLPEKQEKCVLRGSKKVVPLMGHRGPVAQQRVKKDEDARIIWAIRFPINPIWHEPFWVQKNMRGAPRASQPNRLFSGQLLAKMSFYHFYQIALSLKLRFDIKNTFFGQKLAI